MIRLCVLDKILSARTQSVCVHNRQSAAKLLSLAKTKYGEGSTTIPMAVNSAKGVGRNRKGVGENPLNRKGVPLQVMLKVKK